jgi:hypothetical protein
MNSAYQIILEESRRGNPRIGGFRTRRWDSANQQPNQLTKTFWELETNYRFTKFLQVLQMQLLFNGSIPLVEMRALLDSDAVLLTDDLWIDTLSVINSRVVSRDTALKRMQLLQSLLGVSPIWTQNLLYTYLGNLKYTLMEIRVPIGKVKKFSGWVRSSSAVGSKRTSVRIDLDGETVENFNDEWKFNFVEFLSVGRLYGPSGELLLCHPDDGSNKNRNGDKPIIQLSYEKNLERPLEPQRIDQKN